MIIHLHLTRTALRARFCNLTKTHTRRGSAAVSANPNHYYPLVWCSPLVVALIICTLKPTHILVGLLCSE